MLRKLLLAGVLLWMAAPPGNTAKTRNLEDRLNAAMPRVPWPQANPGGSYNSSYPPGNSSYTSPNYSYPTGAGVSGSDSAWTSNQGSGTVEPWPHAHTMYHSHNLGTLQSDFNNLRASYSDTVSAFNNHIGDHGNLVAAVQTLRGSYSQLVTDHNDLVNRLGNANILQ